jgi:hypothetical protein
MDAVKPMQVETDLDRIIDALPLVASGFVGEVIVLTLIAEGEHPLLSTLRGQSVSILVMGRPEEWGSEVGKKLTWFDGDGLMQCVLLSREG